MGLKGLFSVARCVLNTAFDCRCMNYKFSVKKEISSVCVFILLFVPEGFL